MKDFEAATWFGLLAPAAIKPDLVQQIYKDVSKIVAEPEMQKRIEQLGGDVIEQHAPGLRRLHGRGKQELGRGPPRPPAQPSNRADRPAAERSAAGIPVRPQRSVAMSRRGGG